MTNQMKQTTLSVNDPGHDRRNTLQKRRNKIITSPYVNINIAPIHPERKSHQIPIPSNERTPIPIPSYDRTPNTSLYDDHSIIGNPTSEQYTTFSTSLPNRTFFLDDEDVNVMYQKAIPNTTVKVNQKSVQDLDGIRPPSHFKPKPHPRKSSFRRTGENEEDPRQVWQRRQSEKKESLPPMRLPSSPTTPPAYKDVTLLNDNVFEDSQTTLQSTGASASTTLPLPDICSETSLVRLLF